MCLCQIQALALPFFLLVKFVKKALKGTIRQVGHCMPVRILSVRALVVSVIILKYYENTFFNTTHNLSSDFGDFPNVRLLLEARKKSAKIYLPYSFLKVSSGS
jgi:hypothetical protein